MALTDEDKEWLSGKLARTEARVEGLAARFDQFAIEVAVRFEQTNARLDRTEARLNHLAAELVLRSEQTNAKVERVETALLTEFHKWARPVEMKLRSHGVAIRAMELALEAVADRVTKLEQPHN